LLADRRRQARGAIDNPIPKSLLQSCVDPGREAAIRAALASGKGILKVARDLGTGSSVVQRIKAEAVGAPG
jgi:hypothetical protein